MKKTLLFATALAATLAANAQNPIVPVETNFDYFEIIPKAFADAPYILAGGGYDEDYNSRPFTIYNSNLQQVSEFSISTNTSVERLIVFCFDDEFPSQENMAVYFTQTLFNSDNRFEYISRVNDGNGYIVRFDIIADNGNVVNSFGNFGERQCSSANLVFIQIGGNSYLIVFLNDGNSIEWYRIDRQTQRINRVEGLPFNVFPSVADRDSYITVQFEDGATATELQVVDAHGRTLQRIPVAQGQQEVKVSARNLQSGINFIGDRRHGSAKIIVR